MYKWEEISGGIDRTEMFDKEHDEESGDNESILHNGWIYFSNGACRERNGMGVLNNPPKNKIERLKRKLVYWSLCYDDASETFHDRKTQLESQLKSVGNFNGLHNVVPIIDQDAMKTELLELKKTARKYQKKVQRYQHLIEKGIPENLKIRKKKDNEVRQIANEALNHIANIQI